MIKHYQVVELGGAKWFVVDLAGKTIKWFDKDERLEADELADMLNAAYERGFSDGYDAHG